MSMGMSPKAICLDRDVTFFRASFQMFLLSPSLWPSPFHIQFFIPYPYLHLFLKPQGGSCGDDFNALVGEKCNHLSRPYTTTRAVTYTEKKCFKKKPSKSYQRPQNRVTWKKRRNAALWLSQGRDSKLFHVNMQYKKARFISTNQQVNTMSCFEL